MDTQFFACFECGDLIEVSKESIKRFGKPKCCETNMTPLDLKNIHKTIGAFSKIKENLEKELLKGVL